MFELYDELHIPRKPPTKSQWDKNHDYDKPSHTVTCGKCEGKGFAYRTEDNDCVEGYKMADKHQCKYCGGKGRRDANKILTIYQRDIDAYNLRVDEHNQAAKMLANLRSKATPKERKFLGIQEPVVYLKRM